MSQPALSIARVANGYIVTTSRMLEMDTRVFTSLDSVFHFLTEYFNEDAPTKSTVQDRAE